MFLIFGQKKLTLKRYSRSVMKREDWYFKKQKGQSDVKSQQSCDWSKNKSQPPSPIPGFSLNLGYWWNCGCALRQTFLINPCKAVKLCKGSTKARVKHMEGEYAYGVVDQFGNIQYNRKGQGENVAVQKVRDPNKITHRNTRAVTNNLCQGKAQHSAEGTRF